MWSLKNKEENRNFKNKKRRKKLNYYFELKKKRKNVATKLGFLISKK